MELEAPYQALRLAIGARVPFALEDFRRIEIRTDSLYVKDSVGRAIKYWSNNGWTTKEGNAVQNVPDWKDLLRIMRRLNDEFRIPVKFEWKKGKKGAHAKAVDKLAKRSSNSPSLGRSRPVLRSTIEAMISTVVEKSSFDVDLLALRLPQRPR